MASLRACIIGAGASGIAAAKALADRGIPFDCFERLGCIGGNWAFEQNPDAAAYRGLHMNTYRLDMQYADFPMRDDIADFPVHTDVLAYFNDYVDHFDLRRRITFGVTVERVSKAETGAWRVELDTGEEREYTYLLVANGHHWDPRWPEPAIPGHFDGLMLHSHAYSDSAIFADRSVAVIGMGNSAMDIVVESSYVARRSLLVARRGVWISPQYFFGSPTLPLPKSFWRLPWRLRQRVLQVIVRAAVGRYERYGLAKPDYGFLQAHPTTSDTILSRITHGDVVPKPGIVSLEGDSARFADGSVERVDVIVCATGYKITFPFFDDGFLDAPDNHIPLYLRVFHPEMENLAFIGLVQPLGAIPPCSEAQAKLVAAWIAGDYVLPDLATMRASASSDQAAHAKRFVATPRHTIEVDAAWYLHLLATELTRSTTRRRRAGRRR